MVKREKGSLRAEKHEKSPKESQLKAALITRGNISRIMIKKQVLSKIKKTLRKAPSQILKKVPFDSFHSLKAVDILVEDSEPVLALQERVEGWSWWESNPRVGSRYFRSPMTVYP